MAARAAAQAVRRKIRTRRTKTTRRDSPSANVARSAPRRSGTRSPHARDEAESDRRAQRGSGRSGSRRIAAVNASRAISRFPAASSRRPRSVADRERSVIRRISIFWACLRISSTLARARGASPSSSAASQANQWPRTSFRNAVSLDSPGATSTCAHAGTAGRSARKAKRTRRDAGVHRRPSVRRPADGDVPEDLSRASLAGGGIGGLRLRRRPRAA